MENSLDANNWTLNRRLNKQRFTTGWLSHSILLYRQQIANILQQKYAETKDKL